MKEDDTKSWPADEPPHAALEFPLVIGQGTHMDSGVELDKFETR